MYDNLIGIFQILDLFILITIVNRIKYRIKNVLFIIGTLALSVILLNILGRESIFILIPIIIAFTYTQKRILGVLSIILCSIIGYIANIIAIWSLWATNYLYNQEGLTYTILYILIYIISSIIIAFVCRLFTRKISSSTLSDNKAYLVIVCVVLFIIFTILFYFLPDNIDTFFKFKVIAIVSAVLIIAISIILVSITFVFVRDMQYKRNMEEINNYYKYTLKIEEINQEMRKFRHDYVNILSTMSEYIREDDMAGLRDFFDKEILPMKDKMQTKSLKINGLENFHIREIKGLLTTKILQSQEKNIPISIEVPDIIESINLKTVDLSRMIGIILDNAIEASEQLEDEPLIRVGFIQESESVTFIVMNKCQPDMPRVHTLFEENFSTKGDNRGLGLSTLKEIAEDNENVLLDTTIENGFFIQKVEILDFEP
ncbi:quorum-sensing sensor histidine kinase AgrC [Staphylococcus pettenkoferi]|uniref:GHKL domain-containing protein n=1 Tax=Staphylococcus pettenkoferi TaxID=170573 RepID=A0A9Q4H1A4_9STAP|nr:GHKL domain-containing protein [Staphylococcus pettenkoferi]MCY1570100.1 GHKL domain-containing protein [Staphylococcus pettenkoferi]MCY1576711.1 GHKL domain-containing protein [Staphylococcus pettenkoferi]MCY1595614.1 GHKL domain-containing protein [Staphylococcus pettenkoferi]MCY1618327.1 GHKL domain-containing protein [Staphylococcus pettenkoferi]